MITTIDNNQRKFWVQSQGLGNQNDTFCNLSDIPKVIGETIGDNSDFVVRELWNRTWKRVSKKHLNEIFAANGIYYKLK